MAFRTQALSRLQDSPSHRSKRPNGSRSTCWRNARRRKQAGRLGGRICLHQRS